MARRSSQVPRPQSSRRSLAPWNLQGWSWLLVGLALLLGLSPTGGATVARAEGLVVGFEDLDFYPYGRPDDDELFVGYLRSLLDAFARDQGHQLDYEVIPLKRLYLGFGSGEQALFLPDNPAWSREYKRDVEVFYSQPVAVALDGFAVLPGREQETVGDALVEVGTILGFTVAPLFSEAQRETLVLERVSRFEHLFRALLRDRVDAVYCNLAVANEVLKNLGHPPEAVAWSNGLPQFRSLFHISSTNADLIAEIDTWMLANPDTLEALKREFGIWELEQQPWGGQGPGAPAPG